MIGLRLLALAAGLRHNAEIGQPGLCFSAYGHKFGINHLGGVVKKSGHSFGQIVCASFEFVALLASPREGVASFARKED
jgi:hypothetical protein